MRHPGDGVSDFQSLRMYISRFQLHNHKCFYEPPELQLEPGFNILTGQNNTGKTDLLKALSLIDAFDPHRSLKTIPTPGAQPEQVSWLDVSFLLTKDELAEIANVQGKKFYIPYPHRDTGLYQSFGFGSQHPSFEEFFKFVFSRESLTFKVQLLKEGNNQRWIIPKYPSFGIYKAAEATPSNERVYAIRERTLAGKFEYYGKSQRADELGVDLANNFLVPRIYYFWAERFNVDTCSVGKNSILAPNANNLPEVLANLQGRNPDRFKEFNSLVRRILPQVQYISIDTIDNQQVKIIVWPIDPKTQRPDLTISLAESGTGIGQILAILYVVLNSDHPQTILIDEPQSFLHPGAIRKLIEVLKLHKQHQYIIATHSPTVISAVNPSTITMLSMEGAESTMTPLNTKDTNSLQTYLAEIGARLADVFGADEILWVEGLTEERCFPGILEKNAGESLMGTRILGIPRTGDFEGRYADLVLDIYNRISGGSSLLPPAIGFILDRECRTQQKQNELQNKSDGLVRFISRRMYENYLLNPLAIATVVNAIEHFRENSVTEQEVRQLIKVMQQDQRYFCRGEIPRDAQRRLEEIDAAAVLNDIFSGLSETRVVFNKVEHSVALTEWILEHCPEDLREIVDLLENALNGR